MTASTLTTTSQPESGFARFFSGLQDAPWYELFLGPAVDELQTLPAGARVLDVGTGPGKFIELVQRRFSLDCVGVDTDAAMLAQAKKRLANVPLHQTTPGAPLSFDAATFDAVCFCSVLFLLDSPTALLDEAQQVLKPGGQIVVLTPTGRGRFLNGLRLLSQVKFHVANWTFFLWQNVTARRARDWKQQSILLHYARRNHLGYTRHDCFGGFAAIEVLHNG